MEGQQRSRPTVAEIDGRALAGNFAELVRVAGAQGGVLPVIKSDAYGHGLTLVARVLREAGAERFAVATVEEACALRAAGAKGTILVLGGVYPAEHEAVVESRLTPAVWDAATGAELARRARAADRVVAVHIKVDTGMHRLGVAPTLAPGLVQELDGLDGLTVEGILTHFCNAESVAGPETAAQLAAFRTLLATLEDASARPRLAHAANSAAALTEPAAHFDLVRPGLALYGVYPAPEMRQTARLTPVMRLVSAIVVLRDVPRGEAVSYGSTWVATRPSRIATLPVGYADGYPRALSNRGVVLVRGVRVPIAGRVCMDHVMVDVTDVPAAALGDEAVLWGEGLPVDEVAVMADTIPYELLVRVGARVPRVLR